MLLFTIISNVTTAAESLPLLCFKLTISFCSENIFSITGNGAISDNYSGFDVFKGIVTTVEIGNGITAIGENVFTGFTALTETKFDGTQSQWDAVTVADGNEDLTKNVTVIPDTPDVPDTPVTPEQPEEEPTLWDKIVNFFIKVYEWFINLFNF